MIKGISSIEKKLEALQSQKDTVDELARNVIRLAGKCIVLMHANQIKKAEVVLRELESKARELDEKDKGMEYYSLQAKQEYVEALALYTFIKEKRLITYKETKMGEVAYLLGILDLVGELKRSAMDAMAKGDVGFAEKCYETMLDIYDSTLPLKFANSIVQDLRKKQDVARIQIEGLAGELVSRKGQ